LEGSNRCFDNATRQISLTAFTSSCYYARNLVRGTIENLGTANVAGTTPSANASY